MKYIVSASAGEIYTGNITKIQATGAANSSGSLTKVEFGTTHISSSQVYKIKVAENIILTTGDSIEGPIIFVTTGTFPAVGHGGFLIHFNQDY